MAAVLATELLVSTKGTVDAARDLNRVAEAGRSMSRAGSAMGSERAADRLAEGIARAGVKMGALGDAIFMVESAWTRGGRNMEAFKAAIPEAAAFAGMVVAVDLIVKKWAQAAEAAKDYNKVITELGDKQPKASAAKAFAVDYLELGKKIWGFVPGASNTIGKAQDWLMPNVSAAAPSKQMLQDARMATAEAWAKTLSSSFHPATVDQMFSKWVLERATKGDLPTRAEGKVKWDEIETAQKALREVAGGLLRDIGKRRVPELATANSAEGWRAIQEWKQRDSKSDETAQNQLEELMKHTSTLQDINNALSQLQSFSMS